MNKTDEILKSLGKRIAYLRKQKNMSQEEFAEASGKMINTISNIERGISDPKITTLLSIAQTLDVNIDVLFEETVITENDKIPENVSEILKLLSNQDDKTRAIIKKHIEALLEII